MKQHKGGNTIRSTTSSTLAVIAVILVLAASASPTIAQGHSKIGVSPGDWVDYQVKYYSTYPGDTTHEYIPSFCHYNRVHIEILTVEATNVTLQITYFYPDNTTIQTWSGDISKNPCFYLMLAGLGIGDPVCPEADDFNLMVSQTVKMTILGNQMYVNIVGPSTLLDAQLILFFENTTGILAQSARSSLLFGWMVEQITNTSVFAAAELDAASTALILLAGPSTAIAMIVLFTIANRRRCS